MTDKPTPASAAGRPDFIAVDANGFCWRVWDDEENWSMCPVNPDNNAVTEPVTYYAPVDEEWHA